MAENPEHLDVVGNWTEMKLQILQDYAKEYAKILKSQPYIKHVAYIDGFAGAGAHISKESGEVIKGSPARALAIEPRFSHYHFVEMREGPVSSVSAKWAKTSPSQFTKVTATKCCSKTYFHNVDFGKIIAVLCVCLILTS